MNGHTLEISHFLVPAWTVVPDAAFIAGGFNGTVSSGFLNPLQGKRAWCNGTIGAMTQVIVDLSSFVGSGATKLRWHEGDNSGIQGTGWFIDSVTLSNVGTCMSSGMIFSNGFEGGVLPDLWSARTP